MIRETLYFTGHGASELQEIAFARVDLSDEAVVLRGLKKREDASLVPRIVYKPVQVPA